MVAPPLTRPDTEVPDEIVDPNRIVDPDRRTETEDAPHRTFDPERDNPDDAPPTVLP